ncbi:sensor histidine kinase [Acinetobacter gerneri]|jgi:two-component system sensor histidine kinase KdpD|uniref:sensor histidine kinase n=1 Tax=Acinetobacter gerneri TaxID=202952 RepID=UPI0023F4BF35|nr:sensor histidine kinase KdpD [Acinetobacter gerneri]MCH4243701.1 sensor histidine kinase KdpD [Acinetobacter gerneri]
MSENRDNKADVLLQHTKRYQSGRLTIFLGAAPGVGKTYAMLVRAHDLFQQGVDIVIAYVETHGRAETDHLVEGLPIIARKMVSYQGHQLQEMDLDAVLEKKPHIVLVDEFAHTNMPGSRHEKRWQDINELLDAGIDVFTTMNIQHLESLNDVVLQITGVRVLETVPDRVFERIRDIRLIDLPVNELIERLNQGKVYVPEQASYALKGFFTPSNLTALRELAMQTVASHVDSDVRENFAIQGIAPIPLKNHILVLIEAKGKAEALVRAGCRLAENRLATWTVVAFFKDNATSDALKLDEHSREIETALNLARQLGGMTEILYGEKHAKVLSEYAIERGISTIVLAQQNESILQKYFQPSLIDHLLKNHPKFELSIVPIQENHQVKSRHLNKRYLLSLSETLFVLLITICSIAIASLSEKYLGISEISIIFITAVVFIASKTRMMAATTAAILLFLSYDFFFILPKFTFDISAPKGFITIVAFLAAALIASRLASRLKEQVNALKAANRYNSIMQDLSQKLSVAANLEQVLDIALNQLSQNLKAKIWFNLAENAAYLEQINHHTLSQKEKISADWTFKNSQPSGKFTQTLTENEWWFLPLLASKQCLGVVGIKFEYSISQMTLEQKRLAEAMIENIGQAISRTQLTQDLELAKVSSETEKLRSALLSSVSHDLRSPLASMIGAADTLSNYRHNMNQQDQDDLLQAIHLEGERLDRYIQNLLDMTRLGHEGLTLRRDWIGVDELVGSAVRRLKRYLPKIKVNVKFSEVNLSLFVHAALIEQAIFNVLENAAKFSPEDEAVELDVEKLNDQQIQISITDQGQGIPEDERNRIFDMFYTMQRGDRGQYGTGLGLTIVKAIIGAHMGQISASSGRQQKGTCIRIVLPIQQMISA